MKTLDPPLSSIAVDKSRLTNSFFPVMVQVVLTKMYMQPNSQKSSGGFFQDNKNALIVAAIVVIIIAVYFATRDTAKVGVQDQKENTETSESMEADADKMADDAKMEGSDTAKQPKPKSDTTSQTGDAVTFTGTLMASTNPAKGNYVVDSNRGMVYIQSSRDMSALVGKAVKGSATGSITNFSNVMLTPVDAAPDAMQDKGGSAEMPDMTAKPEVTFSGILQESADKSKGTYSITSGNTVVYVMTSKNHADHVGKEVTLTAKGTLQAFHHA